MPCTRYLITIRTVLSIKNKYTYLKFVLLEASSCQYEAEKQQRRKQKQYLHENMLLVTFWHQGKFCCQVVGRVNFLPKSASQKKISTQWSLLCTKYCCKYQICAGPVFQLFAKSSFLGISSCVIWETIVVA